MNFPIWLNADIVKGPVNEETTIPVDPKRFLAECEKYENAVLSIGWTTLWGPNYNGESYTEQEITEMIEVIRNSNIKNREITFPVRAGIAANSLQQMQHLIKEVSADNKCTFTVWSSPNDHVNISNLEEFINGFGIDMVYLDVPKEISDHLSL